jgi:predicted NBD/HSP70 family sugar kinase
MAQACPRQDRIKGVGVSLIGLVDPNEGRVLAAESLSWEDVPIGSMLRQSLNLDLPMDFENGARLAALGQKEKALAEFEAAVRLAPDRAEYRENLQKLKERHQQ